ncbi:MAG: xanthine dehydrogenase family protein subunit M [Sulfolobales archaeon]|nr:xanthine dehydrogenase family protein subunit M [Sulfolobales archaeon]MDW8083442.1 xanthine dehydrogenase family protein subunit M [Sulfolobales archaeon]
MYYSIPKVEYYRPKTLEEAIELLLNIEGSKIVAGGTDLLVDIKTSRAKVRALIDINSIAELRGIVDAGEFIRIGAATKLQEILESHTISENLPLLRAAIESMGSWQIRNLATIGGNLCTASPAADTAPPLLAYDAELTIAGRSGLRVVPVSKFFTGYRKTAIGYGEILKEIVVRKSNWTKWSYVKLGRRGGFTLSIVAVAVTAKISNSVVEDIRIALNSVAPTPIRAYRAEEVLRGKKIEMKLVEEAARFVAGEVSPIDDIRSTSWYRREMSHRLTLDTLSRALGVE